MIEILFQAVALIAYFLCGLRIICFNSNGLRHRPGYSVLATILIASFMGQSVHILFFIIFNAKGNVAKAFWRTT